jgi:hypothetical protein
MTATASPGRLAALLAAALLLSAGAASAGPRKAPPPELARVHIVLVGDTRSNLEERGWITHDLRNVRTGLTQSIPADRRTVTEITGDEVTPQGILDRINGLAVGPNEGVLFYYTGHGAWDVQRDLPYLQLGPDARRLYRKDLLAALKGKNAALTVVLTDCCSSFDRQAGPARERRTAPVRAGGDLSPVARCLLFQHRGLVDVTAAEKGTSGWCHDECGSLFTYALVNVLWNRPLAQLDADGDGFLTWEEFFPQLRDETDHAFKRLYGRVGEVTAQRPLAFLLPKGPGADGTRPEGGWKLGARLTQAPNGIRVVAVTPGSPAEKVGLEAGDVIVSVNGEPARDLDGFARLLDAAPDGRVTLQVIDGRTGKPASGSVQLAPAR